MSIKTYPITRLSIAGLVFVLLVAFWLRASDGAAITHFRYDQGEMALMAMETWSGEEFHWLGTPNSAGIPNSPFTIWIYIPVLIFSHSPQAITLFVGLFALIGVAGLWWIGHRYFGPQVGFLSGLMFAVSPWAVNYSRAIWEPRTIMPIVISAIAIGLYGYIENKRWAQLVFAPLLMIGLQFHYVALTLLPLYFIILWIGRKNIKWGISLLSLGLGLLTFVPWGIGIMGGGASSEATGDRFSTILEILTAGPEIRTYPINLMFELAAGYNAEILQAPADVLMPPDILFMMMGILPVIGLLIVWVFRDWRPFALLLTVWTLITLLVLIPAWTGSGVYHHHFAANLPALSLLSALAVVAILQGITRLNVSEIRVWQIGQGILVLALVLGTGVYQWRVRQYWDQHYVVKASGQTSTPLHYLMDVRRALQDYDDVILFGANPHESNYYVWEPMLYQTAECVRDGLVNGGAVTILPAGRFAAVVAPLNPLNSDFVLPEIYDSGSPEIINLRPGEDPYIIHNFETAPEWTETPLYPVETPAFENGVRLLGYYLEDTRMILEWRLPAEGSGYQYFGHFIDADGNRIGQRDSEFYAGQYWCENDRIITTVLINPVEGEIATLRVGMYAFRDDGGTDNQSLVNDAGEIVGDWVDITINN